MGILESGLQGVFHCGGRQGLLIEIRHTLWQNNLGLVGNIF